MAQLIATPTPWHPSPAEVSSILDEMRPIIADFSRRAAVVLASSAHQATTWSPVVPAPAMAAAAARMPVLH